MSWDHVIRDSVKDNSIREIHLKKVPSLKTCDDWKKVVEVGLIDHKTKYAHYKGALVKLGENIYFVDEKVLDAIAPFRPWKFGQKIKVIDIQPN